MPPATAASIIGVVGKQNSVEMPSRFRISVIASMTSIDVSPLGLGGGMQTLTCAPAPRHTRTRGAGAIRVFRVILHGIYTPPLPQRSVPCPAPSRFPLLGALPVGSACI